MDRRADNRWRCLRSGLPFGLLLAACGGSGTTAAGPDTGLSARGTLVQDPPARTLSLNSLGVDAQLSRNLTPTIGQAASRLLALFGSAQCGVDFHYMEYNTVGAVAEQTNATAALMLPTGSAPACSGGRPLLLYAHGTATGRQLNLADFGDVAISGIEGSLAAIYAAHGYIVVAPNYAGYDKSRLGYHPFHNADQQSKDMLDALAAARKALPEVSSSVHESGKLFLTGYSQGGYVALATARAMQAAGSMPTATVAQSGAYAMSAEVDAAYGGKPIYKGVAFGLMLETSWQKAYGDIYASTASIYSDAYSTGIEALLPNNAGLATLVAAGRLPDKFQFGTDAPNYALVSAADKAYFGPPAQSLLKTSYVTALLADLAAHPCPSASSTAPLDCAPANRLRAAALKNDLRTWTPAAPLLLCGGNADPIVYFQNTRLAQAYFAAHGAVDVSVVDVDSADGEGELYGRAKSIFSDLKQLIIANALLAGDDAAEALKANYHTPLTALSCAVVAYDYFNSQ